MLVVMILFGKNNLCLCNEVSAIFDTDLMIEGDAVAAPRSFSLPPSFGNEARDGVISSSAAAALLGRIPAREGAAGQV